MTVVLTALAVIGAWFLLACVVALIVGPFLKGRGK